MRLTNDGLFNKQLLLNKLMLISFGLWLGLSTAALAEDVGSALPSGPSRKKSIDFDDEGTVEGMSMPLDSLTQTSDKDKNQKDPHLYRKRIRFREEMTSTVKELGYSP